MTTTVTLASGETREATPEEAEVMRLHEDFVAQLLEAAELTQPSDPIGQAIVSCTAYAIMAERRPWLTEAAFARFRATMRGGGQLL